MALEARTRAPKNETCASYGLGKIQTSAQLNPRLIIRISQNGNEPLSFEKGATPCHSRGHMFATIPHDSAYLPH